MLPPAVRVRLGIERLDGRETPAMAFNFILSPENGGFGVFPGMWSSGR